MIVAFWHDGKQIRTYVHDEDNRKYVVVLNGLKVQVPKHSATPLLEEAIKNDNSL